MQSGPDSQEVKSFLLPALTENWPQKSFPPWVFLTAKSESTHFFRDSVQFSSVHNNTIPNPLYNHLPIGPATRAGTAHTLEALFENQHAPSQ